MRKVYTAEEVAQHNTEADCWVTVAGKVLDVTEYLPKHPGGKQLVARSAGQDVTRDFEAMFHSVRARKKLEELCIGELAGAAGPSQFLSPWGSGSRMGPKSFVNPGSGAGRGPYGLGPPQGATVALPQVGKPVRLSPEGWTSLTLLAQRSEGAGCKLLTFGLPNNGLLGLRPSQHLRVRGGDLVRSYTPVAWTRAGSFDLLVKCYAAPAGVMSRLLCGMIPGDEIEFSGPCGEFVWEQKRSEGPPREHVVLAGIGTGVTPLAQLLRAFQDSEWSRGRKLRATLLMGYASEEHVLLAAQLRELTALSGGLLQVRYFFKNAGARLTPEACADVLASASLVCVSGTDDFVAAFRGAVPDANKFHAF
jgi:NAD(P)H-flavin reductase/predicted heme/steroid binding protein